MDAIYLKFAKLAIPSLRDMPNYADEIYVDYLNIRGKFEPVAENGVLDFLTDSINNPSKIITTNFSNPRIITIDTINNEFNIYNGYCGDIAIATVKKNSPFLSLKINEFFDSKRQNK